MTSSSSAASASRAGLLVIERVKVGPARIEALVRVVGGAPMRTSDIPGLAGEVLGLLPGLARHRCECGSAHGLVAELSNTEIAHVLEHVALELMVLAGSPRSIEGDTRWDFAADGHGVFRVTLDYDDDLVALAALREGVLVVEALLTGVGAGLDMDDVVERVRSVRHA